MTHLDVATLLRRGAVAMAAALSLFMLWRASPGGDQLNLLARGWMLAEHGALVPWGNPLSGGGHFPGIVTSLVVGVPLEIWRDHRAPIVLLWIVHLLAWVLLDRAARDALSPPQRAALAVLWALGPMRLEAASTLWNPNYLPAVGAAHLWLAGGMRDRVRFGHSFALVALLGLGAQLHPSMLLLGVTTVLLAWGRFLRFSWAGVAAGVTLTALTVVPALFEAPPAPPSSVGNPGFPMRGLLLGFPLLKGLLYWLRAAALAPSRQSLRLDFTESLGERGDELLLPGLLVAIAIVAAATTLFAAWANVRLGRQVLARRAWRWRGGTAGEWLLGYGVCAFAAAVVVYAAAPTTPQAWQGLSLLHAAALPVVFAVPSLGERFGERRLLAGLAAALALALVVDLALALGSPNYRCAGRDALPFALRSHSPMLVELGVQRRCAWPLDMADGWWPDVLPEATAPP